MTTTPEALAVCTFLDFLECAEYPRAIRLLVITDPDACEGVKVLHSAALAEVLTDFEEWLRGD